MSVIWYKVLSDLWDNKARTLLATLSIATGVFAVGATFGMVDQMLAGMDAAHQAVYPAHIMVFLQDDIDRDVATRLKKVDGVVDIEAANQVGVLGLGTNPALTEAFRQSDLLLVVGPQLGEILTNGYTLITPPRTRQTVCRTPEGSAKSKRGDSFEVIFSTRASSSRTSFPSETCST